MKDHPHTPGPWEVHRVGATQTPFVYGPRSVEQPAPAEADDKTPFRTNLIALVYSCGDAYNQPANVNLIAAAPVMLSRLEAALLYIEVNFQAPVIPGPEPTDRDFDFVAITESIRAVIAEAKEGA